MRLRQQSPCQSAANLSRQGWGGQPAAVQGSGGSHMRGDVSAIAVE